MLAEYGDNYSLNETDPLMITRADMEHTVSASASTHQDPYGMFSFMGHAPESRWGASEAVDSPNNYTLTVLSDGRQPTGTSEQPPHRDNFYHQGLPTPSWDMHGPGHVTDECAVSGSDGTEAEVSSPERRCVKSLLHVALQKGSGFAQQFTSCGMPPYPIKHEFMKQEYLKQGYIKQEYIKQEYIKQEYVSSTSPMSPRPLTPADSLRSYSPAYPTPTYPSIMPPTSSPAYPSVITSTSLYAASGPPLPNEDNVSTTSSLSYPPHSYSSPMPSYSAFRAPYPTPSPQPAYASTIMPLPVHLLPTVMPPFPEQTTPPTTPSAKNAKRRRGKAQQQQQGAAGASGVVPKKRERSERQLHPCTLCEKRFKDNYSVNVHMRTHTGEKPFPCVVCGKMFRQKAHLAKHRSTHQPSEYARLESLQASHSLSSSATGGAGVDSNANSLPSWISTPETKCKTNSLWMPSVITAPVRTVQ